MGKKGIVVPLLSSGHVSSLRWGWVGGVKRKGKKIKTHSINLLGKKKEKRVKEGKSVSGPVWQFMV